MKYKLATSLGFCYGVKRASSMVNELLLRKKQCYTYGELIHNFQATERFKSMGAVTVEEFSDLPEGSDVVIRSHGVGESVYVEAERRDLTVHDCTCPYVQRIHRLVRRKSLEGKHIFIIGDPQHPEVLGIRGWAVGPCSVVDQKQEFPADAFLVAQTTLDKKKWEHIVDGLPEEMYQNTICSATRDRQDAARELAKEVDLMIVVGGKHSSNTKKLYQITSELVETLHIETEAELDLSNYKEEILIGICAGASTPDWIIENVIKFIQDKGGNVNE